MRTIEFLKKQDQTTLYKHFLYIIILTLASGLLIWKCKYGFGNIDESFYITIPYRLFKGDALFLHEWHLSQMAGFLTFPIVSLYLLINGSTVGIVLFLRYVCTIFQIITAIFIYIRLNKINWLGALISSLSYVLYIPFGIMALSYNSMAVMTLVICTVIIFTAQKRKNIQYIIAGLFYAAAVLCCPYLAIVFVLYAVAVFTANLICKLQKKSEPQFYFFTVKGVIFLSIGAAIAAGIFTAFVFTRASLSEILQVFPMIMNDPEHPSISFIKITEIFITSILSSNSLAEYIYPILIALVCICLADKKKIEHKLTYLLIVLFCVLVLMLGYYNINSYINHIMWSLNILALFITILTKDKTIKNIFYSIWITGILYAFCLNATSNQKFYAISSASATALVGSIMIICIFTRNLLKETTTSELKNLIVVLISLVTVLQIFMQISLRYNSVFWEKDMASQDTLIEDGSNAGLYVTKKAHENYYNRLENLKVLEEYDAENVLYLSSYTWYYLAEDYNMSTFSAWLSGVNEHSIMRLKAYFEFNPDKLPDAVYVDKDSETFAHLFCDQLNYKIDYDDKAFILVKE